MLVPSLVAALAVGLGLLLGLGSSRASPGVGALRTFAFAAALTVALTHLLPEALAELGAPAVLLFAATSVAPAWGRILVRSRTHDHADGGHAALSAGYAGLVVHHVGDGLGLGAYSELPGGPAAHADVLLALAVHTVPLVAVVTLAFRSLSGTRAAVGRAAGLAGASIGGVVLSTAVPEHLVHALSAWIAAGVAGLLMHVVTHDLGRDLPITPTARALDITAAIVGIATSMLGADADLVALRSELTRVLRELLLLGAPALVAGWALALLIGRLGTDGIARWLRVLPGSARGFDGALVGTAIAGPRFGILFWVGTALSARLIALRAPTDPPAHPHDPEPASHAHHEHAHEHEHAANARIELTTPDATGAPTLAECVRESAPWIVAGLVLATLLIASLREQSLGGISAPLALAGAAAFALPLELPPVAAVLVALGLWDRGLRAEAALAFALMASARKGNARALGFALVVGLGVGSVNQRSSLYVQMPHALGIAGIALLALGIAFATWERGLRGLFTGVFHSHDSA
ncbi:MAG TPA: hypothetical protein VNN72_18750 [Polyangiaceae bacterium]|nr:hypothetical protein [Polyangiaceae bacterium]